MINTPYMSTLILGVFLLLTNNGDLVGSYRNQQDGKKQPNEMKTINHDS